MNYLDKLERKYGKYAINNLMLYMSMGQVIVFALQYFLRIPIISYIYFDVDLVLSGQIWRLITFAFVPNTDNPFLLILAAYIYYSLGRSLEEYWGSFKFNVYYFAGLLFNLIAMIFIHFALNIPSGLFAQYTTLYLNLSLFLAFATMFPNVTFLVWFILPIKAKYLAFIDGLFLVYEFIQVGQVNYLGFRLGTAVRILIVLSLLHYLLFFLSRIRGTRPTATQRDFRAARNQTVKRELKQGPPLKVAFHKCSVCGKTELTDPDMEFRYCSKCNGNYEYCMDHLHNHEHKE